MTHELHCQSRRAKQLEDIQFATMVKASQGHNVAALARLYFQLLGIHCELIVKMIGEVA